jgi:hypothetical protein
VLRYFTEWAMTIFTRGFSFDLVTRVWDVFLNEGIDYDGDNDDGDGSVDDDGDDDDDGTDGDI